MSGCPSVVYLNHKIDCCAARWCVGLHGHLTENRFWVQISAGVQSMWTPMFFPAMCGFISSHNPKTNVLAWLMTLAVCVCVCGGGLACWPCDGWETCQRCNPTPLLCSLPLHTSPEQKNKPSLRWVGQSEHKTAHSALSWGQIKWKGCKERNVFNLVSSQIKDNRSQTYFHTV